LQDFGDCIQSSQIGPHLVQPLRTRPMATTPRIKVNRLHLVEPFPMERIIRRETGRFQAGRQAFPAHVPFCEIPSRMPPKAGEPAFMQTEQQTAQFDIEEARRTLADVFAPWVQDLGLSISGLEYDPPPGAAADWQPGAILRMAFSERLCRHGGIVCGQALMALADTAMVIAILAANRGYRPMTTVDQTTHFMRAVTKSDVLADARVVRLGRTMSFGRVTLLSATDNKPVAIVSSAFAMLP
jgi:uncharacterized protein (TIGR00369 family)